MIYLLIWLYSIMHWFTLLNATGLHVWRAEIWVWEQTDNRSKMHPYCTSPSSICVAASRPVLAGMKRGVAGLSRNMSVWHSTLTSSMWSLSSSKYISKIHISERFQHLISEFITVLSDGKMHGHSEIYTYAHGKVWLGCVVIQGRL